LQHAGQQACGVENRSPSHSRNKSDRLLEQAREQVLKKRAEVMDDFDEYYPLIRRFDMKTNARNQYLAKVRSIKLGQINAEVILDIGGGRDSQRKSGAFRLEGRC